MSENAAKPSGSASPSSEDAEPGGFLASFGVSFDPALLELALTHRSWAYEHGLGRGGKRKRELPHNERLEFLGDSVLGQASAALLYRMFPDASEQVLSKRRAAIVSTVALAEVARGLGVGERLKLGKGEARTGGRDKDSILADAVEAIIGAAFLSTDFATADRFVRELLQPLIDDPSRFTTALDPKTELQIEAGKLGLPHPPYETTGEGPDHARVYAARVSLGGITGTGTGTSKRVAELEAARDAVEQIRASE